MKQNIKHEIIVIIWLVLKFNKMAPKRKNEEEDNITKIPKIDFSTTIFLKKKVSLNDIST